VTAAAFDQASHGCEQPLRMSSAPLMAAISRAIRYNFNFSRGFNPTQAFMGASRKFHLCGRCADVRLQGQIR
jgi:hypothetical protein